MNIKKFHSYLHQQILTMIGLSLVTGLAYLFLGWLNNILLPAVIWYSLLVICCIWGYKLYQIFLFDQMSHARLNNWYKNLTWFFYLIFFLWTVIFILYAGKVDSKLHYIAIFTQISTSVVASTVLFPDKKLYLPNITILMLPLIIYFAGIQEWYGYILGLFAFIFMFILLYAAESSNKLLLKTDYQASHDQLTGLYNRNHFTSFLQQTFNTLKANKQFSYLLLIDLDHFKTINDSLGHDIGDQLLVAVAKRMKTHLTKQHTLARLGGDEFIITGPEFNTQEDCQESALLFSEQLLNKIKASYIISPHHLYISASIGLNILNDRDIKAGTFVKEADIAMYEVKSSGRNGVILFNDDFSKKIEVHLKIERLLHFALERNEIKLKFQPQLDKSQQIIGCEVLVRWVNKELGNVSPESFIPIAEQTGLIIELGTYILEESFKTLYQWEKQGIKLQQFSINISMRQFFHHDFISNVSRICQQYIDSPVCSKVIFELTETIVAEDIRKLIIIMNQLKVLGLRFSMDDFGTGYSSLSYITQLPIDELKIDRSFVSNLNDNEQNKAMVSTILNMAKTFGLSVVGEGVTTSEEMDFLIENHCDVLQGYYFSKPISKEEFEILYALNLQETKITRQRMMQNA